MERSSDERVRCGEAATVTCCLQGLWAAGFEGWRGLRAGGAHLQLLTMPGHAFVDESIRNGYLMSAAVIATGDLAAGRGKLRELCKPGQRRIHMKDENDSRRREILATLSGLSLQVHLYRASVTGRPIRDSRDRCLRALIPALLEMQVDRLVIESCGQDHRDNQVIQPITQQLAAGGRFTWLHLAPSADPLLWAADAAAWAFGKGGDWRRRVEGIVAQVTDLP
jgi:hypothetical protein